MSDQRNEFIKLKVLSSLEKCFHDESLDKKTEKTNFVMFKNQRLSFQVGFECTENLEMRGVRERITVLGELAPYVQIRQVTSVPCVYPVHRDNYDEDYLRTTPGLYPDMLTPLQYEGCVVAAKGPLQSIWLDVELPDGFSAGEYKLKVCFNEKESGRLDAETELEIRVVDALLPPSELIHTEWFYTDCIAEYYGVKAFSEKHWKLIENFISSAVKNGINMILTPVFTPEIDTYVGGERMTTQLVEITVDDDGGYSFDFEKLGRWVDMCKRLGVKYFEIPHFFTQWGSKHAPKIIAKVRGKKKRIFGWETDSVSDEYKSFLGVFIPAIIAFMKEKGVDRQCYFHISDEPNITNIDQYGKCKDIVYGIIGDEYPIIDALSDYEFYKRGHVKKPAVSLKRIDKYIENKVDGIWCYYFGACGCKTFSDRAMAMKLQRTRVLGVQMYKYGIEGFLHWGFNFYHNENSYDFVDIFSDTTGNFFGPSGDAFLVYPGHNGEVYESLRLNAMREAMLDIRVLKLCESIKGREFVLDLIDSLAGCELSFSDYPKDAEFLISLYEKAALACEE